MPKIFFAIAVALTIVTATTAQTTNFTPVEGASLKAKIDNAVVKGKAGAPGGSFWVGYQFEVRPGVAIDFEIVGADGTVSWSNDGWSIMSDSRYETREVGLFLLFAQQSHTFTCSAV